MVVDALARQFVALGHEVFVLAPPPRSPQRADDSALPYPVIRQFRFLSTRRFLDGYAWYLGKLCRKYHFDVLHCHSVYPTGYVAARSAALDRTPLVITSHSGDISPESRLLRKPGLPDRFLQALRRADSLVAINEPIQSRYRELCPRCAKIVRIPNGVDGQDFARPAARPMSLAAAIRPKQYVLFLGRLVHRKGADLLLKAFAAVGRDDRCLVVAGDGPEDGPLRALAASLGIAPHTHFLGQVGGRLKNWLLQNAILTAVPSRISEGFPLVVLESYAAGRPVVATDVPGLNPLVIPGRTGLIIPEDSVDSLACCLRAAWDYPETVDDFGVNARALAAKFDWAAVAGQHVALYEQLLCRQVRKAA